MSTVKYVIIIIKNHAKHLPALTLFYPSKFNLLRIIASMSHGVVQGNRPVRADTFQYLRTILSSLTGKLQKGVLEIMLGGSDYR